MSILVIAEHDNSSLKGATLNTVTAATGLNGNITLLIAGSNISSVIDEAKKVSGISNIISCDDELYKNFLAEDLSKPCCQYFKLIFLYISSSYDLW